MIVWIAGWPHCGSTLLRTFLRDTFGMKVYSIYPEPALQFAFGPESDAWAARYTADREAALAELDEADEWYAVKTHGWPTDDRRAIYIARDGRDAIGSLSRFWDVPASALLCDVSVRANTEMAGILKHQRTLFFGSWSSHFLAWDIENRPNGYMTQFGQILKDPELETGLIGEFLKIKPTGTWIDRFDEYQAKWPKLYDDKNDERRGDMSPELEGLFWRLHGPVMQHLGFAESYATTSNASQAPEHIWGDPPAKGGG